MSQKSQTPDERLLLKLYELASAAGDPQGAVDVEMIARILGQKETAMKNIIKHLAQANFVKKYVDGKIYLTERGCQFVLETNFFNGEKK